MSSSALPDSAPYVSRAERPVLVPFVLTVILFGLTTYFTLCPPSFRRLHRLWNKSLRALYSVYGLMPALPPWLRFLSLEGADDLTIAINSFSSYHTAQTSFLNEKHRAYYSQQTARQRTVAAGLRWIEQLERVEECVELNSVLTGELSALGMERAGGVRISFGGRWAVGGRRDGRVVEVLKHFVRDWSSSGKSERDALFPPILTALCAEFALPSDRRHLRVLVPGAGLARLAWEIARLGFSVDANDFSHFMSIGQDLIFRRTVEVDEHVVHPYIHLFSHQRSVDNLTRAVRFPDVVPRLKKARGAQHKGEALSAAEEAARGGTSAGAEGAKRESGGKAKVALERPTTREEGEDDEAVDLNFVHGDFTTSFPHRSTHDALVSLFFLDTSSSLLSYLEQIYHSLKPGGIWINLGPLLYYGSPSMELPLDLVLQLALDVGFELERTLSVEGAGYTGDERGMYRFLYDAEGWVMRKPRRRVLVIRDREEGGRVRGTVES